MPNIIHFKISGHPTGKGRPRTARMKNGMTVNYTPQKTRDAENSFISQALPHKPQFPFMNAVGVRLEIIFPVPKSYTRIQREKIATGELYPEKKPDIDNVIKLAQDAMNGIFYLDDKQVVVSNVTKVYGDAPGIKVWLWEVGKDNDGGLFNAEVLSGGECCEFCGTGNGHCSVCGRGENEKLKKGGK
jgi:Holliday junction resolvase RusA-like endonuclease